MLMLDVLLNVAVLEELNQSLLILVNSATSLAEGHLVQGSEFDLREHVAEERIHSMIRGELLLENK